MDGTCKLVNLDEVRMGWKNFYGLLLHKLCTQGPSQGTGNCERVIEGHGDGILDLAISRDGNIILSGSVQPEFSKRESLFPSFPKHNKPAVLVCTVSRISLSYITHVTWSAKIAWFTWLTPTTTRTSKLISPN